MENSTVMPVPVAYNDMSAEASLRDHVGWVWYQKNEFIPDRDKDLRIFLTFESAQYYAVVYFNSELIGEHEGGHLPFSFEVTDHVKFGADNKITVAVNNTLSYSTIPEAEFQYKARKEMAFGGNQSMTQYAPGFFEMTVQFDFFNYAGLLRTVYLEKKPKIHIDDIRVVSDHVGAIFWKIVLDGCSSGCAAKVRVFDADGNEVMKAAGLTGSGQVKNPKMWWPRGMGDANLYTFRVKISSPDGQIVDQYDEEFGFRSVTYDNHQMYINNKPFYCIGFGMHEDSEIHGRGYDEAVMTKDLNLFEWVGANCYRTSHYPYAQERIRESDRRGIAVILETPAVGLKVFTDQNLKLHKQIVTEMIMRDKNHPSVIMWSLSNEPHTERKESRNYFKTLVDLAHDLDQTRPVTIVYGPSHWEDDQTADLIDVVCLNRYWGWYDDMGYLETVNQSVVFDYTMWYEKFKKAMIMTEYGADSIVGLNQQPAVDFSEQYQNELIRETHKALDHLRQAKILTGEMIWNFADFMTAPAALRAVGNHKGIFTRTRQAKQAAYTLRDRYLKLLPQV
ncbi:unnamed protein product, partial [Mesorhabditis spiculigera]